MTFSDSVSTLAWSRESTRLLAAAAWDGSVNVCNLTGNGSHLSSEHLLRVMPQ